MDEKFGHEAAATCMGGDCQDMVQFRPGMEIIDFSNKGEMRFAFNETMVVHEELRDLTLKTDPLGP